jgi:hypothetical protein
MRQYNETATKGEADPLGKMQKRFVPQDTPAIDRADLRARLAW